jgi:hypothetical protein
MDAFFMHNAPHLVRLIIALAVFLLLAAVASAEKRPPTYCNPVDLDYHFSSWKPGGRSAADPTIVVFKCEYWLFLTGGGNGYWRSPDLVHWTYVEAHGLPHRNTAPTVEVMGDKIYWTAYDTREVYATDDPGAGVWTKAGVLADFADPDLFLDDDGRLYMYYGCSHGGPIMAAELDPKTFAIVGAPVECFRPDIERRGWEVNGEENRGVSADGALDLVPWVEAPWMTKHAGKYYLQYSAPGTEFKTYADGVFVADRPLGPFSYAPYSPFSHKPTGFIGGAGHGNTFQALDGSYWRIVTMPLSVRDKFERRLGLFPVGFEPDGQMLCNTTLGDYPMYAPGVAADPAHENSPGWMLLSHGKPAEASSTLDGFPVANAFDENIRTWWSARTGGLGEWLCVDLGKPCRIEAVQVNLADQGSTATGHTAVAYRYVVEVSDDGSHWREVIDRSAQVRDSPHDYTQLDTPIMGRYVRITNVHSPGGALFSLSGLRVFGNGPGDPPAAVTNVAVHRDPADPRHAEITWRPSPGADGYIVRYGIAPDRLFNNYQVYKAERLEIDSLNAGVDYYFTVDAFNDSGVAKGTEIRQGK